MASSRHGSPRPILAACSAAHAAHGGLAAAVPVLLPLWAQSFGLSLTQAGVLTSVFLATMTVGRLTAGRMSAGLGARRLLALGTLGTAVGWLLLAEVDEFRALLLALAAAGLGSSVQRRLGPRLVGRAHQGEGALAALRVYRSAGDAGRVVVPALLALGIGLVGWRASSTFCGLAMALVALGVHLSLQRFASGEDPPALPAREASGVDIVVRRHSVPLGVVAVIDAAMRSGFLLLVPFLMVEKGLPVEQAGFAIALVFAGGVAGKLVCDIVAGRLGTTRAIAITEVATALGIVATVLLPMGGLWVLLAPIGLGLGGTSAALDRAAGERAPEGRRTGAIGLLHTVTAAAGAAAPIAFGAFGDTVSLTAGTAMAAALAAAAAPIAVALHSGNTARPHY